jgi:hypothetical protein
MALASLYANPMPVVYTAAAIGYIAIWQRWSSRFRWLLIFTASAATILLGHLLSITFPASAWSPERLFSLPGLLTTAGMDQLWIYNDRYFALAFVSLLVVLTGVFSGLRFIHPAYAIVSLLTLNLIAINALPSAILFPVHKSPLAFIPERMSLFSAILACCLIAMIPARHWIHGAMGSVCFLFFMLTWQDDTGLTRFGRLVDQSVTTVPVGARVIASLADPDARLDPLMHLVDRACLGRCFSYGNYEPVSGHFRVKAVGYNGMVLSSPDAVKRIEKGDFVVQTLDEPVYAICECQNAPEKLCAERLIAGQKMCSVRASVVGN